MTNEIWKDILGYEGSYQVSSLGRVRSLDREVVYSNGCRRNYQGKVLNNNVCGNGYESAPLSRNGVLKPQLVHILMCRAFIPNPLGLPQVNHKDENKRNNYIHINEDGTVDIEKSNLEWCTAKYNINYGDRNKRVRQKQINNTKRSKTVLQKSLDGIVLNTYPSANEASRCTGVNNGNISACARGIYKSAGGYKWEYA